MAAKQPRPGDMVELAVAELDDLGAGVGRVGDTPEWLRVHVAGALPGERVRARLAHLSVHAGPAGREAWAEIGTVLASSPDRASPACPAHGRCGACPLMGLAYPAQLAYKRGRVAAQLTRYPDLARSEVDACAPSPVTLGYRNQAKLVYGRQEDSGRPVLGAFAPRSHRVVDLAGCRVVEPVLEEAREKLLAVLWDRNVEPFDEHRRTAALRYAVLRATGAGQVLVALVTARADWPEASGIAQALAAACPAVVGVVLNVNPTTGNRIFGDDERVLWGESTVEDVIPRAEPAGFAGSGASREGMGTLPGFPSRTPAEPAGYAGSGASREGMGTLPGFPSADEVRVRLVARSFFQANRQVAGDIYRAIVAAAPPRVARALDVYAGAGGIALSLAPLADEVIAIEQNHAATAAAAEYLAELGGRAGRVRLVAGDAAPVLAGIADAELVVLNPPRKGCAPAVLAAVARLRPQLLAYVSCDPVTLARDLASLVSRGARIVRIAPFDMMPHTPHVETLALVAFS